MSDEADGWNPLLHLDECDRTFREVALGLKANGRLPDRREVAEGVRHLAEHAIRAKAPERWARDALTTPLPPKTKGRPSVGRTPDIQGLAERMRPYCETDEAAHAEAERHLSRRWNPHVVRELVELVRAPAQDQDQARRWVGAFLGLSAEQVKRVSRKPDPEP
ncbi:MAG: hypothetical protein EOM91_15490 [Sphingobacteriia bacterium]|nr:hypothetical protein [Sphingobacteriia bacterium]